MREDCLTILPSHDGSELVTVEGRMIARMLGALEKTAADMERMAATQQLMAAKITDLERELRLRVPLSRTQEANIAAAIRRRARELLAQRGITGDRKALTALSARIRRAILDRYGVRTLREAPAYDYEVALEQAARWQDAAAIMDIAREARRRAADDGQGAD